MPAPAIASVPVSEAGFLEVDGGRIYYEVEGDGHPLLLIHGGLGSLRMWDEQVPAFAERYQVIRYDTRGFGRTETEEVEFTNRGDAAAVLDHVGASSAYVVGQSRGGMIALDLTPSTSRTASMLSSASPAESGVTSPSSRKAPTLLPGTRGSGSGNRRTGRHSLSSRPRSGSTAGARPRTASTRSSADRFTAGS